MTTYRNCAAILLASLVAVGCQPAEEIQSYSVPKEVARQVPPTTAAAVPGEPTDRMLAAILPDGQRAWFLKVVGPLAQMEARADEIYEFFASVRLAPSKPHPDWQLPAGWKQEAGSQMRAATLRIPTDANPLELSVIQLPWGGPGAGMLSNVNRWRGQLQLPPTDAAALADEAREITVGDATLTIVDLRGQMGDTGMRPPFAGRAASAPPRSAAGAPASAGSSSLPAGHPPINGATAAARPPAAAPMTFDLPEPWQQLPATGLRKLSFRISAGQAAAEVSVMDFPSTAPKIADPLANANRWRNEVGLPPVSQEELATITEAIEIDGRAGTLVNAVPNADLPAESRADRGTVAAMTADGPKVWFFKLFGDRDLVASQEDNFRSFLKSIRFTPVGGAGDGD